MVAKIQWRRGTAAAWSSANTVLAAGEAGYETDTGKVKIGDGTTAWTPLAYTVLTVPGSDKQVVFNDTGAVGASANLTFSKANSTLTVGTTTTANATMVVAPAINCTANASLTLGIPDLIGSNGYSYLPNGLIVQWGSVLANSSTGDAVFSMTFPTATLAVALGPQGTALIGANVARLVVVNTSLAQIRSSSVTTPASNVVYYVAIGI